MTGFAGSGLEGRIAAVKLYVVVLLQGRNGASNSVAREGSGSAAQTQGLGQRQGGQGRPSQRAGQPKGAGADANPASDMLLPIVQIQQPLYGSGSDPYAFDACTPNPEDPPFGTGQRRVLRGPGRSTSLSESGDNRGSVVSLFAEVRK